MKTGERVLITGALGFVGSVLCERLAEAGYQVRAALRTSRPVPAYIAEKTQVGDIGSETDWTAALAGVDHVIHAAARVHILRDASADLYMETNARGTLRLAEAAATAGVSRFIFLSSVKVNGEGTEDRRYTAADAVDPRDPYGASKWKAEQHLLEVASKSRLHVATVRPPLVYGPGVRANFLRLMSWVQRGVPLPLGSVNNRRSLVSVWNLCDLIARLLKAEVPAGRAWMVSDGEDLATPELIRRLAILMNRKARLLPVPPSLLLLAGGMLGRGDEVRRLCGSLAVDISATVRDLAWQPPLSVDESLARTVKWFQRASGTT